MRSSVELVATVSLPLFLLGISHIALSTPSNGGLTADKTEPTSIIRTAKDQTASGIKQPEEIVLSGVFVRTFGDPPSGQTGGAQIRYTLTTSNGEKWNLVFDEDRYWPTGGIRDFHLQQVVVRGIFRQDSGILVESIMFP